ncbi:MAG: hypothetical protein OXH13_08440 [Chloroflexi bacterium]|nr:hypothetical protein [Chloroflexota bacterium]MCY3697497.1 hypothetical protein [Chloroflexota bacterium]
MTTWRLHLTTPIVTPDPYKDAGTLFVDVPPPATQVGVDGQTYEVTRLNLCNYIYTSAEREAMFRADPSRLPPTERQWRTSGSCY